MNKNGISQREQQTLDALVQKRKLNVSDAVCMFGISESTARRMFAHLEERGLVIRAWGGIMLAPTPSDYLFDRTESSYADEKKRIGEFAASLVKSGDTIFLDSGTTLPHMCSALCRRTEAGQLTAVRVFTASLANMQLLKGSMPVSLLGGEYRENRRDLCGYITEETLRKLHFTACFLGCDGYDAHAGCTTTDFDTARINSIAMENSNRSYLLADSGKCGKTSVLAYGRVEDIDVLITGVIDGEYAAALSGVTKVVNV